MQSWQAERQLSLVLGYPTSTTTPLQKTLGPEAPLSHRVIYQMSLISADVIDRNQDPHASYTTTVKIDQNMEEAGKLFPDSWWALPSPELPLADFYYLEVSKFLWFSLQKLVHLPYMLKSIHDIRYEHNRQRALTAAREQIRSYVRLRNYPGAEVLMCELMDFVAFSAGVCLAIGSLYMPRGAGLDAFSEDGSLMEGLIISLNNVADLLECRVAEQSSKVLQLLTDQRMGGDTVEVAVPYFGVIKVNVPLVEEATSASSASGSTLPTPQDMAVEFNTCNMHGGLMQLGQSDELAADWFAPIEGDLDYDWQQTLSMFPTDGRVF